MHFYKLLFALLLVFILKSSTWFSGASIVDGVKQHHSRSIDLTNKHERERRGQTISSNHDIHRRAVSKYQNCNTWSPWINDNRPTNDTVNKDDTEVIDPTSRSDFCPTNDGADASRVQCQDDRKEPFTGSKDGPSGQFSANCTQGGVSCTVADPILSEKCPDFAISFYCNCSMITWSTGAPQPTVTPKPTPISTEPPRDITSRELTLSTASKANDQSTSDSINVTSWLSNNTMISHIQSTPITTQELDLVEMKSPNASSSLELAGNGDDKDELLENKTFWLILFVVCVVLSISNCILMIILHKRAMKYAKDKSQTKVEPY